MRQKTISINAVHRTCRVIGSAGQSIAQTWSEPAAYPFPTGTAPRWVPRQRCTQPVARTCVRNASGGAAQISRSYRNATKIIIELVNHSDDAFAGLVQIEDRRVRVKTHCVELVAILLAILITQKYQQGVRGPHDATLKLHTQRHM